MYNIVKRFYDLGIYADENVKTFVNAGKLTKEEYKEITGKTFK